MKWAAGPRTDLAYLVYQMGKVGSSSVFATLRDADLDAPLYKVHYLSDFGLARGRQTYADLARPVDLPHEQATAEVRRRLRDEPGLRWKVVTLVREPIARDVSAYLQMVDVVNPALAAAGTPPRRLARAAAAQFLTFDEQRSYCARWFDDELRASLGIDVFAQPFPHEQGYARYRTPRIDLLVLRTEDLNGGGAAALSAFLDRPVTLRHDSSRNEHKLQSVYVEDVYRQVVRQVHVPRALCARVYASAYARHFYTPSEIEAFTRRWSSEGNTTQLGSQQ